jgi:hypothetical protein
MSTIKIQHTHVFEFREGGDCDKCDMRDYCLEAFDQECDEGTLGYYEEVDEEINQIEDETETTESLSCGTR